jgi:hypothetical protein
VDHVTDLDWHRPGVFLFDLGLLDEAVELRVARMACGVSTTGARQIAQRPPRSCPCALRLGAAGAHRRPGLALSARVRYAPEHAYGEDRHGELRAAVAGELQRFMAAAY